MGKIQSSGSQQVGHDPLSQGNHVRESENTEIYVMICNSGKMTAMKQQQK